MSDQSSEPSYYMAYSVESIDSHSGKFTLRELLEGKKVHGVVDARMQLEQQGWRGEFTILGFYKAE